MLETVIKHFALTAKNDEVAIPLLGITIVPGQTTAPGVQLLLIKGIATRPANNPAKLSEEYQAELAKLIPKVTPAARPTLIKLASTWGVKGIDEQLAAITKTAFATLAD